MDKRTNFPRILGTMHEQISPGSWGRCVSMRLRAESCCRWAVHVLTPAHHLLISLILLCSLDQQWRVTHEGPGARHNAADTQRRKGETAPEVAPALQEPADLRGSCQANSAQGAE